MFKDKHREWFVKYNSWFVIPVLLIIIPVIINKNEIIDCILLAIQWLFIGLQYLGLIYQRKEYKKKKKEIDERLLSSINEHIREVQALKLKNPGYDFQYDELIRSYEKLKEPYLLKPSFKERIHNWKVKIAYFFRPW